MHPRFFVYMSVLYVCMYVFMYACMYACMYVCMYVCTCVYICAHACMCVCAQRTWTNADDATVDSLTHARAEDVHISICPNGIVLSSMDNPVRVCTCCHVMLSCRWHCCRGYAFSIWSQAFGPCHVEATFRVSKYTWIYFI